MPKLIGYEFLREHLNTGAFPLGRPAAIFPVTKVTPMGDYLQVPAHVAPAGDGPLDHLLFALKHEGLEMQSAILALKKIDGAEVAEAFTKSPSSSYIRQAGYLWELANQSQLGGIPAAQGGYELLFDPNEFITSDVHIRSPQWRIVFNGLGSPEFCPTVRRTSALQALLDQRILDAAADFVDGLPQSVLDRAVRWAYLSETRGSYQIEREMPTESKEQAFAALLAQAHETQLITEDYLAGLQQIAVTNRLLHAHEFRNEQNWLRGPLPGVLGVTYVPPPPDQMMKLMRNIMNMANAAFAGGGGGAKMGIDPIVMGAVVSCAFVYAHPFMDGNGRLSRFLFHRMVCGSGQLKSGLVLPISVAMKRNEAEYLQTLQAFSKPAREAWEVTWIDGDHFDLQFKGEPEVYQYWDATAAAEFGLRMAQEALDKDLRSEGDYLARYDRVHAAVNGAIDMGSNDMALLVQLAIQNAGVIPNNRIRQYVAKGHPLPALHRAQTAIAEAYEAEPSAERQERLYALSGLRETAGASYIFWQHAVDAIEEARTAVDVPWSAVHLQVARESFQKGQTLEEVIGALVAHSPGAVTAAGQASVKIVVNGAWDELQRQELAERGPSPSE